MSVGPTGRSPRRTGFFRSVVSVIAVCMVANSWSAAAPPDVKSLFPSGLQQGSTRTLKVAGKPGTAPISAWCAAGGLSVTPNESGDELVVTADANASPGLHWIRLYNAEGASQLLPVVVGVLPETTESELAEADSTDATPLPATVSGVLSKSGEVDSFPVLIEQGRTLVASVDSNRSLGSPADVVMQLVSEEGFVVEQNDDFHGFDPQIVFTPRQSGKFVVRLFAFPAEPNSTIRFAGGSDYAYRLILTTGPFVDHVAPLSQSEQQPTSVRRFGWNIPDDEQTGPMTAGRFPGTAASRQVRPPSETALVEEPRVHDEDLQRFALGAALTGHVARQGEVDTFSFEGAKGQSLSVTVNARSFGSPLDPVLRIVGADGSVVKEADDVSRENVDVRLDLKIPADGTYRAEITDRYGHGGMRYVYELCIEEQRPQFFLSVKVDRYTLKEGGEIEVPVAIERQGGFAEDVTVSVRGLPEGVSAEAVVSAPKGDSAKEVKLKLKSNGAAAFNGPIEIIGTGADEQEAVATTPTPSAGATTTNVWLAVVSSPDHDPPAESDKQ